MSKADEVFQRLNPETVKVGLGDVLKGVKEWVNDMAPGLTLDKIGSDIAHEFKQQAAHGAHELAAALFSPSNTGFVLYPRAGKENEQQQQQQMDAPATPEQTQERGGRGR